MRGAAGRWLRSRVVVAGFILLSFLSNFYIDILWYREVDLSQVFWTRIWAQAGLAAAFFVTFFALLLVNLYVTRRLAPKIVALTPEQEIVERFRENIEPYLRWALPAGAAILSLFVGLAAASHWQEFLLWRSSGGIAFGSPDAVFGRDPAFYVFTLPWLKYLQGWLFGSLVGVTVIVGDRSLPPGGDPAAGGGPERQGRPPGPSAPLGTPRVGPARESVGLLPRPVRSASLRIAAWSRVPPTPT